MGQHRILVTWCLRLPAELRGSFSCFLSVVVSVGVCGNVCCLAADVKDSVFSPWSVLYICVRDVMDVVFSVSIVTCGAVGARVWEV